MFEVSQADLQNDEDQAYRKIMPEPFVVSPLAPSILVPSLCTHFFRLQVSPCTSAGYSKEIACSHRQRTLVGTFTQTECF